VSPRQYITRIFEVYPTDPNKEDDADIGDDVTVVDNGQSYQGKVAEKDPRDPQGKVKVSFRGPHPANTDFKTDQLRRDDPKKPKTSLPRPSIPPMAGRAPGSFL
jgi:hypothetical protein